MKDYSKLIRELEKISMKDFSSDFVEQCGTELLLFMVGFGDDELLVRGWRRSDMYADGSKGKEIMLEAEAKLDEI